MSPSIVSRSASSELTSLHRITLAVEQFFPPTSFAAQAQPHLLPAAPIGTLLESRIDAQSQLPESTLESWRDTVGMIVANRTAGDSAALTALGDALAANGWTEAAHVW